MQLKILIIRLSSLGDIVLTAPVIAVIRARYPEAEIDMVVKQEYLGIAEQIPGVNFIHPLKKDAMDETLAAIRREEYDLVLDLHGNFRSRKITNATKAKYARVNKRSIRRWLTVKTKRNWMQGQPDVIGRYFEAAARVLNVKDDGDTPSFQSASPALRRIAICPGSKHWNKQWPTEYYAELAASLVKAGYSVELFGAKDDMPVCNAIAATVPTVMDRSGKLSLKQLPSALAGCALAITNDSGLMHVASAVGVPVLSFFGPTVKSFGFAPRASNATVLENEGLYCRPCTTIGLDHCPEKHFRCMREITPAKALITAQDILRSSTFAR